MSRYIILQEPHPLDDIWVIASNAVVASGHAFEALDAGASNEIVEKVTADHDHAIRAVMALPARNFADIIQKLLLAGVEDGEPHIICDVAAIMSEACILLDDAIRRYDDATDAVDYWEPPTQRDFIRKFLAMFGDAGHPSEDRIALLVRQGKRLIDGGRL